MKNLLNLGKAITKVEQAKINGGHTVVCSFKDGTGYNLTYENSFSGFHKAMKAKLHCRNNQGKAFYINNYQ